MIYFIGTSEKFEENAEVGKCSINYALNYFKDKEFIQLDTETHGFDPRTKGVICWQIGDGDNQFVIEQDSFPFENYKWFFEDDTKTFILQNAKFDLKFFLHKGIIIRKIYDTFLTERILTLGLPRGTVRLGLDALVERYCHTSEVDKDIRGQIHWRGLDNIVIKYAAGDVKYLEDIKKAQLKKAKKRNLFKTINLQNKYCPVLAYTEYCGFKLDVEAWDSIYYNNLNKLNKIKKELDNYIIDHFPKYVEKQFDMFRDRECTINWNSADQIIPLFRELGLNLWTEDNGERKESVENKIIYPQRDKHELIPLYLKYTKLQKACSTYGLNISKQVNPISGRLHTQFTQIMETGRLSSGGKDNATGVRLMNFQNIPSDKKVRACFIAEGGNTLVVADYSGQEQIVLANQSADKSLIEFYEKKIGDMHSFIASKIYNVPLKDIKQAKQDDEDGKELADYQKELLHYRQQAKAAGFAINYGGNGYTISQNLSIPIEDGERLYNEYFKVFPGLKNYFNSVKKKMWSAGYIHYNDVDNTQLLIPLKQIKIEASEFDSNFWDVYREEKKNETDYYKNVLGPKLSKHFRKKSALERKSQNYPIQGTSASITKVAGILFYEELIRRNWLFTVKICNFVHDEIVVECPKEMAKEVAELLQQSMEKAGEFYCKIIPLKASPVITNFWKH